MPRNARLYSLFRRKRGTFKWERLGIGAFPIQTARRIFQTRLIEGTFNPEYEFRLKTVS